MRPSALPRKPDTTADKIAKTIIGLVLFVPLAVLWMAVMWALVRWIWGL